MCSLLQNTIHFHNLNIQYVTLWPSANTFLISLFFYYNYFCFIIALLFIFIYIIIYHNFKCCVFTFFAASVFHYIQEVYFFFIMYLWPAFLFAVLFYFYVMPRTPIFRWYRPLKMKMSSCLFYHVQIYPGAVELMQVIEEFIHIVGLGMKDFHNAYLMTGNLGKNRLTFPPGPQPLSSFYQLFLLDMDT